MEWDATRAAPPAESKPEARDFPIQTYDWTESKELFKQPSAYPEPPKDMWYQIPETKPKPYEPPPAIFPWERESRPRPKPTRVFAEDLPQKPDPEAPLTPTLVKTSPTGETGSVSSASTPSEEPPAAPFSPTSNAWDNDPSIDRYVRAVKDAQERRFAGKRSPIGQIPMPSAIEEVLSPLVNNAKARESRRESLILTDFPSAMDRPSLPVTPAPIRRPTFWGTERDAKGELPSAEGVPEQAEWVCSRCGFSSVRDSAFVEQKEHVRRKGSERDRNRSAADTELKELSGAEPE